MWNLINCYLSGRHDYGMWCESGAMFLRCVHCGKRSCGWAVEARFHTTAPLVAAMSAVLGQMADEVAAMLRAR